MRTAPLCDQEIALILTLAGRDLPPLAICRRLGIAPARLRLWRRKAAALPARRRALLAENARLRQRVADLVLDKAVLRHAVLAASPER